MLFNEGYLLICMLKGGSYMEGFVYKGERWKRQRELMDKMDKKPIKASHVISDTKLSSKEYEDLFKDSLVGKAVLVDDKY